ncbi:hypothetical protein WG936_04025 [Corynebacterium sp. H127]|uniref:hypothetical protein n=1 Tax=Corynebacterium sp. H127 TaxID=3133418 RepID=UPI003097B7F7
MLPEVESLSHRPREPSGRLESWINAFTAPLTGLPTKATLGETFAVFVANDDHFVLFRRCRSEREAQTLVKAYRGRYSDIVAVRSSLEAIPAR